MARGAGRSRWRTAAATIVGPTLIVSGLGFVAAGTAHGAIVAAPPVLSSGDSWAICHATNSDSNPYQSISPNVDSIVRAKGHYSHTGPVWDPTLKVAGTQWGDIIPPFVYNGTTYELNWTGNAAGQAIFNNGCNPIVSVVSPTVKQAVCTAGVLNPPTLTIPTTAGVTYTPASGGPYSYSPGQTVIVTATPSTGLFFKSPAPAGWQYIDSTHEQYSVTFDPVTCELTPQNPTFTQATCTPGVGGAPAVPTPPTLTVPASTAEIDYTASGPAAVSTTVTITATIKKPKEDSFVAPAPPGWTLVSATVETYMIVFANQPNCALAAVAPTNPVVFDSSCSAGSATVPSLVVTNTATITYTVAGKPVAGGTVTVTATIVNPATNTFLAPGPGAWKYVSPTEETLVVTFAAAPTCTEALVLPTVAQASCSAAGLPIAPSLTLPKSVAGLITYSQSAAAAPGTTVTVTATIVDTTKYDFAKPIAPWTAGVPGVATYDVVFAVAPVCVVPGVPGGGGAALTDVLPVAPSVTQASCVSGVVGTPTMTPATTTGLAYSVNPAAPYAAGKTVVVTATITDPAAYALATPAPAGWTYTSATTATLSVVFTTPPCSGVGGVHAVAVAPVFVEASCHDGKVTDGTYTLPRSSGVVYRVGGVSTAPGTYPAAPGSLVVIRMAATGTYQLTSPAAVGHTFAAAPTCHGVEPATTSHTPPPLAQTGTKVKADLTLGTLAITLGLGLMLAGRRRRVKPAIR